VSDPVSDELLRMRERLATQVIAANRIGSERVASALHTVPRHLFLPELRPELAYADDAIVTKRDASGQPVSSSSQPAIMAIMLDQLDLAPGHRVLEIGAGTGYNAALISHIVAPPGQVTSVDIDGELVEAACAHLAKAGYPDVTIACADGAGGYPAHAPYDRIIATVGVSDLAPAWLEQAAPGARIVVPLDVRGTQLSAAFGRADPGGTRGPWTSRSVAPCGFMRMRGSLAGPERVLMLAPGLAILLPNGAMPPGGQDIDAAALAAMLAGPSVPHPTTVRAGAAQVIWGLGLWLAAHEPRSCRLSEELPSGSARTAGHGGPPAGAGRLIRAPLRAPGWHATMGILDSGGIALLTAVPAPAGARELPETSAPSRTPTGAEDRPELLTLGTAGFGPRAAELAADLARHVQAWGEAGRVGLAGLHVDAYPRSSPGEPPPIPGALVMERPSTRFVVYHT
jgi:protein-L-isoaspartate(D-aspartate) O-methyltransferase